MSQEMALKYRDPWRVPKIALFILLAFAGILFLPAVIVATGLYLVGRKALTPLQWGVILTGGLIGIFLSFGEQFKTYFIWLFTLIGAGDFVSGLTNSSLTTPLWLVPVPVFLFGLTLAAGIGMFTGGDGVMSTMSPMKPSANDEVVPEDRKRIRKRLIKRPAPLDYIPVSRPGAPEPKGPKQDPKDRKLPLGRNKRERIVWLSESEIKTHGVILGSTGSGKTETIKWLAGALMDMDYSVLILDLKEDLVDLREFTRGYARQHKIPYQEVALSDMDGHWYLNAIGGMSADSAFDAVVGQDEFDDAYHQSLVRKAAGQVNKLLFHAHELWPDRYPEPTIFLLGSTLQKDMYAATKSMLAEVTSHIGQEEASELYSALFKRDDTLLKEAQGYGTRLTNLYDSKAGRNVLMPGERPDGQPRVPINVEQPGLTYIGASSLAYPELAGTVSSAVLTRVNVMAADVSSGRSKAGKRKRAIIVDEANFVNRRILLNLLSRARSAGITAWVATQAPNDFIDEDGDDWARITQNINVSIFGKMTAPGAAELAAEFIGMEKKQTASRNIRDGIVEESGSLRENTDYIVPPEVLRDFQAGEMVVRTPEQVQWMQVPLRNGEVEAHEAAGSPAPPPPN